MSAPGTTIASIRGYRMLQLVAGCDSLPVCLDWLPGCLTVWLPASPAWAGLAAMLCSPGLSAECRHPASAPPAGCAAQAGAQSAPPPHSTCTRGGRAGT